MHDISTKDVNKNELLVFNIGRNFTLVKERKKDSRDIIATENISDFLSTIGFPSMNFCRFVDKCYDISRKK